MRAMRKMEAFFPPITMIFVVLLPKILTSRENF